MEKHFRLNTGALIPAIGLGTWPGYAQEEKGRSAHTIKAAIEAGYRHIDCASGYHNQQDIGNALQEIFQRGIVKREDLWITSKLWNSDHDRVEEAFEQTLRDLQLDYLDLYLVHWPVRSVRRHNQLEICDPAQEDLAPLQIENTWTRMQELFRTRKARAIGVCNFSAKKIDKLLQQNGRVVVPAVNQVECHPVWQQEELHKYCSSKGIHLSGYSPLGNWGPTVLKNPLITELAEKLNKTPAQIALRWGIQSGHSVLPKSSNPGRLRENLDIFEWNIPDEDMRRFSLVPQERVVKGRQWVNDTTSPYTTLEELWDE